MLAGLIRNITARKFISALKKDGFILDRQKGSHQIYIKGSFKVLISYHRSSQTFPISILQELIKDAGWSEEDLRQLKLIK